MAVTHKKAPQKQTQQSDMTQQSAGVLQRQKGENQMLNHGRSTMISDIRRALTTKHNQIFMLTAPGGDIVQGEFGHGIYFRDTCFLDQLEMRLNDQMPIVLLSNAARGDESIFELTNPDIDLGQDQVLHKERLSVRRRYVIADAVTMTLDIHNLAESDIPLGLTLAAGSQFLDMFTIRGADLGKRGTLHRPRARGDTLVLAYDGADGHRRTTTLTCSPKPDHWHGGTATFALRLSPGERLHVEVQIDMEDRGPQTQENHQEHKPSTNKQHHDALNDLLKTLPEITTSNPLFDLALARSLTDLRMLAIAEHGDAFLAAGVPWYVALFGRDSLITAFETLALQPQLARSTLLLLASYQGTKDDDFTDEAPGKILHELRVGERANLHEIPQIPYYGTVDATPWFLIVLGEYVRWTGDITLFDDLRDNVERALGWIDRTMQHSPSGFLDYGTRSAKGLVNQGWKDSGNSIVNRDGSLAQAPIALVEVQGYVYAAKRAIARLYRQRGNPDRAEQLAQQAEALQRRFERAYWMSDADFYALALQGNGSQAQAIASNAGQTMFTRIARADRAAKIARRLMASDMNCGWGVRTLSSQEKAYNPLDYQVGSVWPHDNAIIALGLRRYGLIDAMQQIFTGIFEAATQFPHSRLPEVFDGFSRDDYDVPVHYPVACSPQAWAAGALPLLLQAALGLEPDAPRQALQIHRPSLPPFLTWVEVRGMRVGQSQVDLRYQREGETTLVAVEKRQGDLAITIDY
jgi:glycogen debranching enzyme